VFQVAVGFDKKIPRVLAETEKTEPLREFHDRAGFGLLRGRAFAHLFLCADDFEGVLSADT
jgi:hypothetical protein